MLDETEISPHTNALENADTVTKAKLAGAGNFEREQLTRRSALRKIGVTAGLSTFALLSIDDLARMVGNVLQQRSADNKIISEIARSFQQSGVANAAGVTPMTAGNCTNFQRTGSKNDCDACNNDRYNYCVTKCPAVYCASSFNSGAFTCNSIPPTYAALQANWALNCRTCLANCN